ncbi:unnamed protein product [Chondrus crispus]|uniref:Uncharacterized protein n=1 Tax=Chondrus crispus TaxID=2769 RepID=R7QCJ7_CHOCR|nr:unnamed protein product [Chondrus crispus]CDF35151.1 unnamed protein product [Chondrus crispus]|eukprot:XP_005714970.1 unnamed protein product [Chondrus crispus]
MSHRVDCCEGWIDWGNDCRHGFEESWCFRAFKFHGGVSVLGLVRLLQC